MLNNGWPSLIWHLYGYDLAPAAGYFGAKKANEPLHIQYSYDDRSVVVVNQRQEAKKGLRARARVYELDATQRVSTRTPRSMSAEMPPRRCSRSPRPRGESALLRPRGSLRRGQGRKLGLYWVSRHPEIADFAKTKDHFTPMTQYADYKDLAKLPAVTVAAHAVSEKSGANGEQGTTRVSLENSSTNIAFFVRLKLAREGGEQVLPVLWEDNYVSLLPGEKREIAVKYKLDDLHGATPAVEVSGWNVAKTVAE